MEKKWFAQIVPMITEIYNEKVPIKDVSPFPMDKAGFLGAERNLPQSRGVDL